MATLKSTSRKTYKEITAHFIVRIPDDIKPVAVGAFIRTDIHNTEIPEAVMAVQRMTGARLIHFNVDDSNPVVNGIVAVSATWTFELA